MTREVNPNPCKVTNVITPSVPLWLVAVVFFKENDQLCYAMDWTPVLALGCSSDTFLETSALILHYERDAPIWVNPSTRELRGLDDLIGGHRAEDESVFVSRIVAVEPDVLSADPLDDLRLSNGLLLYNDEKFEQFQYKNELHLDQFAWLCLT